MSYRKTIFGILVAGGFWSFSANGQYFSVCKHGSVDELVVNISSHSEHVIRMDEKFLKYFYEWGELPREAKSLVLDDVQGYLKKLKGRRAAFLFYAFDSEDPRLCAWLVTKSEIAHSEPRTYSPEELQQLQLNLMQALSVTRLGRGRVPVQRGVELTSPDSGQNQRAKKEIIRTASELLFPEEITDSLSKQTIDTLLVVPVFGIGTVPFSALRIRDKDLIETMSFVIAPGFQIIKTEPLASPGTFANAIILGDPCEKTCFEDERWEFAPLQGARREAEEVANYLRPNARALVGSSATKSAIYKEMTQKPDTQLVYLATHGIADAVNPLDESFLLVADGRWTAREIGAAKEFKLTNTPLVVMSACQTGLGKTFDGGNTGLARAWQQAGASNVVMSLWNVDDIATQQLMTNFIKSAKQRPPDKALQEAIRKMKTNDKYSTPAYWAGFSVFGAPEL